MHEAKYFCVRIFLERIFNFIRVNGLAPCVFNDDGHATGTLYVFNHAAAEYTVAPNDDFIAGRYRINKTGFHSH